MSAATTGLRDAAAILGALSTTSAVELHAHTLKLGFLPSYLHLCSSFLKSYAASGRLASARQLFDETPHRDIPLWNALVSAYARSRQPEHALLASSAMVRAGSRPNNLSVTSLLSACAQLRSLVHGRELHGYAVRNIPILDLRVLNVLVSMYGRCGRLAEVDTVFASMGDTKNVVSWTCMINAFCENGRPAEALEVFNEMRLAVVKIDEVTLLAVISACTKLDCPSELGEWVEEYACENGFLENTPRVANALIHMHGKMGRVKGSCEIFDSMSVRTVVSWTAMIQALAVHGHGMAALVRFSQMLRQGFWPDEVIFLSVINSCGHSRLVSEGRQLFKSMVEEYHITPWMEHYGSMVDLLCRSGMLEEAFEFVLAMPVKPDPVIWRVLTGACRDHGNTSLARKVIDHVIDVEPNHGGNYVLASNLYAADENWGRVVDVRVEMGVRKETSRCSTAGSYIEVNCEKKRRKLLFYAAPVTFPTPLL